MISNPAFTHRVTISGNTSGTPAAVSSGTLTLAGGNNITLSQNGNAITISAANGGGAGDGVNILAAGTQTANTTGSVLFQNSNGITFGMSNSSVITATVKTDYQSSNANYLTSQSNQALSAANGSFTFQTATFANSNGVSFSTGTQGIFASVKTDYLTTARASNDAVGLNTAQSNVTWTVNSSGISLDARGYAGTGTSATNASITLDSKGLAVSVAAPGGGGAVNFSAGTTSNNLQSVVFSNSNGVSFGLNGSTITASVNAGGGAAPNRSVIEIIPGERVTTGNFNLTATQFTQRPIFQPFWLDGDGLNPSTVRLIYSAAASSGSSASLLMTAGVAFYSRVNSTSMALASSTTNAFSITTSSQWSGIRILDITGLSNFSLSEGPWCLGLYFSALHSNSVASEMRLNLFVADPMPNFIGYVSGGTNNTSATNASSGVLPFWGVYSATSNGFPAGVGKSNMSMQSTGVLQDVYAILMEIS